MRPKSHIVKKEHVSLQDWHDDMYILFHSVPTKCIVSYWLDDFKEIRLKLHFFNKGLYTFNNYWSFY
jgi:hypothetical protein